MGLVGYYRQFIEGFLKIPNPITESHKNINNFVWTKKCAKAFQNIKELLMTMSILKLPEMDKELLVCTDASKEGLGGILMQDSQVITYISRKLRKHEDNYTTHDLELLEILHAFTIWILYLIE
jgi:hypothetical protein